MSTGCSSTRCLSTSRICAEKATEYGLLDVRVPSVHEFKRLVAAGTRVSPMINFFLAVGFPRELAERADHEYRHEFAQKFPSKPFPGIGEMLGKASSGRDFHSGWSPRMFAKMSSLLCSRFMATLIHAVSFSSVALRSTTTSRHIFVKARGSLSCRRRGARSWAINRLMLQPHNLPILHSLACRTDGAFLKAPTATELSML